MRGDAGPYDLQFNQWPPLSIGELHSPHGRRPPSHLRILPTPAQRKALPGPSSMDQ